ncbi:hypothetical protein OTK59_13900 [Vibrio natriegens]|uniref:hypothetical protein n=1 Tax=Vibrio natriegens TaxID=691 RepID=UPI002284C67A|nr:hypothetical protein [Vibrio natriegens]MCY9877646.1 hypothetical protein [Vibrio natriegens]
MKNQSTCNDQYVLLPNGDLMKKALIGSCSHYADHGVILLNPKGEKLLWIPQADNTKAIAMRDEIVAALMA